MVRTNNGTKKIYICIIAALVILSIFLFFRTNNSGDRSAFKRIIENYINVKNGLVRVTGIIKQSIEHTRRIEIINRNLRTANQELRIDIDGLRTANIELRNANAELERITGEFEAELERSSNAIGRLDYGIGQAERLIERIREAGQNPEN